jgi:cysteine desulfuration protein SufE
MMPDASLLPPQETAAQAQQEIVEAFGCFDDWTERSQLLTETGRARPALAPEERSDRHRARGCRALTWFVAEAGRDGHLHLRAASESAIVAGLSALLLRVYSGRRPDELLGVAPDLLCQCGLDEHVSPQRQTGVLHILEPIQAHARAGLRERSE